MDASTVSFVELITEIHRCNAFTVIGHWLDAAEKRLDLNEKQRELITFLGGTNDLDEIRLGCAIYLGLHEEAQTLRDWIATRPQRQAASQARLEQLNKALDIDPE